MSGVHRWKAVEGYLGSDGRRICTQWPRTVPTVHMHFAGEDVSRAGGLETFILLHCRDKKRRYTIVLATLGMEPHTSETPPNQLLRG